MEEILNKLVNEWAPVTLQLGIQMTWYNSLHTILTGIIWLIVGIIAFKVGIRDYVVMVLASEEDVDWDTNPLYLVNLLRAILCVILVIGAVFDLLFGGVFSPWTWIGLYDPKVKLAHDIFIALVK